MGGGLRRRRGRLAQSDALAATGMGFHLAYTAARAGQSGSVTIRY